MPAYGKTTATLWGVTTWHECKSDDAIAITEDIWFNLVRGLKQELQLLWVSSLSEFGEGIALNEYRFAIGYAVDFQTLLRKV